MDVQPYLFFEGRCEEAIHFYVKALGADVLLLQRFKDSPDPAAAGGVPGDKVMHASLQIGKTIVMASDGRCTGTCNFQGFALSVTVASVGDAQRRFNALADGGHVQMPLAETFWTPAFGMVTDRFGVSWMVAVTH